MWAIGSKKPWRFPGLSSGQRCFRGFDPRFDPIFAYGVIDSADGVSSTPGDDSVALCRL